MILEAFKTQADYYCQPKFKMSSNNLIDAINECGKHPSCRMFYDHCGRGDTFSFCDSAASVTGSACGSILYNNGNE